MIVRTKKFRTAGGEVLVLFVSDDPSYNYWECGGCGRKRYECAKNGYADQHVAKCREIR